MRTCSEESHSESQECAVLQDPERSLVGDLFMSLIHTCELNGVNSFRYLTELQRHSADVNRRQQLDAVELPEKLACMQSSVAA